MDGTKQDPEPYGTMNDGFDAVDELEGLLDEALQQQSKQQQDESPRAPTETRPQHAQLQQTGTVITPTPLLGREYIQSTTQNTLNTLAKRPDGTIDVDRLTPDQLRIYNAFLMNLLTEEQLDRYEAFRRSSLKDPIKRLIQIISGQKPDNQSKLLIAMSSVAKSFVGELIEEAKRLAEEEGHGGPLLPVHLIQAYQRLRAQGLVECAESGRLKLKL